MNDLLLRRIQQQGGSPTPTLPYVQNGLIGWWDGLWNIGIEQHDNNASEWIDLTRNGRNAILNGCTWNDNSITMISVYNAYCDNASFDGSTLPYTEDKSWEFCFKWKIGNIKPLLNANIKPITIRSDGTWWMVRNGNGTLDLTLPHTISIVITSLGRNYDVYCDGIYLDSIWTGAQTATNNTLFTVSDPPYYYAPSADYYCFRTYNKALSSTDRLTNYNTDKQRFNF